MMDVAGMYDASTLGKFVELVKEVAPSMEKAVPIMNKQWYVWMDKETEIVYFQWMYYFNRVATGIFGMKFFEEDPMNDEEKVFLSRGAPPTGRLKRDGSGDSPVAGGSGRCFVRYFERRRRTARGVAIHHYGIPSYLALRLSPSIIEQLEIFAISMRNQGRL